MPVAPRYLQTRVSPTNRYRLTSIRIDDSVVSGRRRLGLWKPPNISLVGSKQHTVTQDELQRPDLIAWRYYRNVNLWWVIAYVNNINNPLQDMVSGQPLFIPTRDAIDNAILKVVV